jgi:hypothetical protein
MTFCDRKSLMGAKSAPISYRFLHKYRQSPIFCDGTMAKALAPSLELCKCAEVRAVNLSYLTRRPALRGQHARWSGWPALDERKRIGGVEDGRKYFASGRAERRGLREPERSVHQVREHRKRRKPGLAGRHQAKDDDQPEFEWPFGCSATPHAWTCLLFRAVPCSTTRLNNAPTLRTKNASTRWETGTIRMHTT